MSQYRPLPTFTTHCVVRDGPVYVPNGERSEGGLGHCQHLGVGDVLHGPDVLHEVVADDGPLHPEVGDDGVRGILDGVTCVKEGIFTETSQCQFGALQQRTLYLTRSALFLRARVL